MKASAVSEKTSDKNSISKETAWIHAASFRRLEVFLFSFFFSFPVHLLNWCLYKDKHLTSYPHNFYRWSFSCFLDVLQWLKQDRTTTKNSFKVFEKNFLSLCIAPFYINLKVLFWKNLQGNFWSFVEESELLVWNLCILPIYFFLFLSLW